MWGVEGTSLLLLILYCCVLVVLASDHNDHNNIHPFSNNANAIDMIDAQIKLLKNRIQQSPDTKQNSMHNADLWRRLGLLLQSKDVRQHTGGGILQPEVLEAFDKALKLNDDRDTTMSYQVYEHRGMLLKMMGRGEDAIASHDLAIEFASNNQEKCDAMSNKAAAMVMLGTVQRAVSLYRETLNLCPDKISTYLPLVQGLQELGTMKKPDWESLLVEIKDYVFGRDKRSNDNTSSDDEDDELSLDSSPSNQDMAHGSSVYWALFEVADKVGQYSKAWRYLEMAHKAEEFHRPIDPNLDDSITLQVNQIKSIFTQNFWPTGVGLESKAPIFIVGMMRSGSTLLETMLDAHPNIWGLGEDSIFNGRLSGFRTDLVAAASGGTGHVKRVVDKHGTAIVNEMQRLAESSEQAKVLKAGSKRSKRATAIKKLGSKAGDSSSIPQIKHIVDKMLFNYRNLGFIHLVFPNALILHTIRDPMDTLFSCYKHKFDDIGLEWTLRPDVLVHQYAAYLELIQHFRNVLPNRVMDIRYENLISNPEGVMRKIVNALNLSWDDAVMNFHKSNRTVHTHSQSQVRHQISSKYMGVWRKYAKELKPMMTELRKYMPRLKKEGALSYYSKTNWALDPFYDYNITVPAQRAPADSPGQLSDRSKVPASTNDDEKMSKISQLDTKIESDIGNIPPVHFVGEISSTSRVSQIFSGSKVVNDLNGAVSTVPDQPSVELVHDLLANISTRAAILAARSPRQSVIGQVQRILREEAIAELYRKHKFKTSFSQMNIDESRIREFISQLKYHNLDVRLDELVSVGYVHISLNQFRQAIQVFDGLLEVLYFDPNVSDTLSKRSINSKTGSGNPASNSGHILTVPREYIGELTNSGSQRAKGSNSKNLKSIAVNDGLLVDDRDSVLGIMLGLGTCLAMVGRLAESFLVFSDALRLSPVEIEIFKRRSEVLTSMGRLDAALQDINSILTLSNHSIVSGRDILIDKGKILMMQSKFLDAYYVLTDIPLPSIQHPALIAPIQSSKSAADNGIQLDSVTHAHILHLIGKCHMKFGETLDAMAYFQKSIVLASGVKEVYIDAAFALMEASRWEEALVYVDKGLALDKKFKLALGYRGLLNQNLGRHKDCVSDFTTALMIDPNDIQCMLLSGVCYHALGDFANSNKMFQRLLAREPKHHGWFRRESMLYLASVFDTPLPNYNPDDNLNVLIRDGMSQGDVSLIPSGNSEYLSYGSGQLASILRDLYDRRQPDSKVENLQQFVQDTHQIGSWIQLRSPGFLPNKRNHVSFGLSVLQAAQALSRHVYLRHVGKGGLWMPNSGASKLASFGSIVCDKAYPDSCPTNHHLFGWRDFMDIIVRWRQLSEPMDVVYWLDRLTVKNEHEKRLGLNTYMIRGYNKVIRYYPYFEKSLNLTKKIVATIGYHDRNEKLIKLAPKQAQKAQRAANLQNLFQTVSSQNMFVVVPCASRLHRGLDLNGTRITLTVTSGDTFSDVETLFDFSICSASTPERFRQYEEEMHNTFEGLLNALEKVIFSSVGPIESGLNEVLTSAMDLFYYWVNFAPLSRGTSATGYAALYASIIAAGREFVSRVPQGKQLDWEAILSMHPDDFIAEVRPWLATKPLTAIHKSKVWLFSVPNSVNSQDERHSHVNPSENTSIMEGAEWHTLQAWPNSVAGAFVTASDILQTLVRNEV